MDRVHSNLDRPEQDEEQDEAGQQQEEESEGEMTAVAVQSTAKAPKRKSKDFIEQYLERKEARQEQRAREREERDEVYLFLMSLAPTMRRLPLDRQSWLRIRMQEMFHEAEFGASYSQPPHVSYTQL